LTQIASHDRLPAGIGDDRGGDGPVRVVVADDSLLLRSGIVRVLEHAGLEVAGEAADGEELCRLVRELRPDIAITDIRMPPTHGDEGMRAALTIRAEQPDVAVLVLSHYVEEHYAVRLLEDGAASVGYLLKDRVADPDGFTDAVRRVAQGGSALDPEVVSELLTTRAGAPDPLSSLTEREEQVMGLMAEGHSNRVMASRLGITDRALERHVTAIFEKLGLPADREHHRRVLAVLRYVRATGAGQPVRDAYRA
jgi:DNA-binding NarL/FixJ family response regulator